MTPPLQQRATDGRVIAIVQAASLRIGIAGEHVVQAVVVPPDMACVPRRAGAIAGVITHGDQMVPVVRLQDWLSPPDADAGAAPPVSRSAARIVILRSGDIVVGLLVEAVIGMRRCPDGAISRLFHDDRPDELFAGAVRLAPDTAPLALLEPSRLAALAGVWCAAAGVEAASASDAAPVAPSAQRTSLGVFRIGDVRVGIAVADIGELLLTPVLRAPPMRHPTTRGLCDWRGRLLPVVDIAGVLGAQADTRAAAWMCVVRHGELALGVLVDEIVELHGAAIDDEAIPDPGLVRRELSTTVGVVRVLDTAALMAACPESCIGLRGHAETARGEPATSPHTYLVFEAAGRYASRIDGVQEIVSLPEALRPRIEAGLAVSLQWRDRAVPVRALFDGQAPAPGAARLLMVVVSGARRVAIPITGVQAMIAARTATLARLRVRGELVDVVSTSAAAPDRATYELVDLEARAVARPALPQAA